MERWFLVCALLLGAGVVQPAVSRGQALSPAGLWPVTIPGSDKSPVMMTFSGGFTVSDYGITRKHFGFDAEPVSNKGLVLGLTPTMPVCPLSFSAEMQGEASRPQPVARRKPVDPASGLQNQDSAFSLLIEAFRQIQGRIIQNDYENRIQAANALADLNTRRRVMVLANQERELRLHKLYHQIGNLNLTYENARRDDERAANVEDPAHIDTAHAARTLMDYVFIAPVADEKSGEIKTKTVPASNYLLGQMPEPVE